MSRATSPSARSHTARGNAGQVGAAGCSGQSSTCAARSSAVEESASSTSAGRPVAASHPLPRACAHPPTACAPRRRPRVAPRQARRRSTDQDPRAVAPGAGRGVEARDRRLGEAIEPVERGPARGGRHRLEHQPVQQLAEPALRFELASDGAHRGQRLLGRARLRHRQRHPRRQRKRVSGHRVKEPAPIPDRDGGTRARQVELARRAAAGARPSRGGARR